MSQTIIPHAFEQWRKASLAIPDLLQPVNCTSIAVHPWTHGVGQQTESGTYLSPANALAYLAVRLAGRGGQADVIVLMAAAESYDNFMHQLTALAGVFPTPAFTQVARLAKSAAELATVKMQRPAADNALPPTMPLSVPSTRLAHNATRIESAQAEAAAAGSIGQLEANAQSFAEKHADLLAESRHGFAELKNKRAQAWVFTARGSVATAITAMKKEIPQPSAIFSAAVMFIGEDLSPLEGMINDINNDTGA